MAEKNENEVLNGAKTSQEDKTHNELTVSVSFYRILSTSGRREDAPEIFRLSTRGPAVKYKKYFNETKKIKREKRENFIAKYLSSFLY